jgi:hypothetical protein
MSRVKPQPRTRPARRVKPKRRPESKPTGPESKYDPAKLPLVVKWLEDGKTQGTIAQRLFGITPDHFTEWKHQHPELTSAIETGERRYWEAATDNVERVLVANATGRVPKTVNEVRDAAGHLTGERVVEYHPPSVAAGVFVTCNKRPDKWQNVQRVEVRRDGEGPRPIVFVVAGAPTVKELALDPTGAIVQELPGGNGHDGPKALTAESDKSEGLEVDGRDSED